MAEGIRVGGGAKKEGLYVWKKLTAQDGDFIDYVVSDSETAYPDGGTQDGYWYELFDLKSFGIDFGEVTLASTAESVTVSHNLGVVPSWVALIPKVFSLPSQTSASLLNINGKVGSTNGIFSLAVGSETNTLTTTEITFASYGSARPFMPTDYYWFAMA